MERIVSVSFIPWLDNKRSGKSCGLKCILTPLIKRLGTSKMPKSGLAFS
jgi:hypothetical protein